MKGDADGVDLQLTVSETVASFFSLGSMARFQAAQRYSAPSSSLCGRTTSVETVAAERLPPGLVAAPSNGFGSPFRYHLTSVHVKFEKKIRKKSRHVSHAYT